MRLHNQLLITLVVLVALHLIFLHLGKDEQYNTYLNILSILAIVYDIGLDQEDRQKKIVVKSKKK